jgi:hypothetical protein
MKIKFNSNFKFTFKNESELDRAMATGYIPDYEIVRINIVNQDGGSIDYPVKHLEAYKNEVDKINNNSYIVEANAYAANHYFDIQDYE